MNVKDVIYELRTKKGMSQDELAEKVYVTRQAVSRWENGDTIPNTETLKLLSEVFDVSINTLLGSPRQTVCHCCGMPLKDFASENENNGTTDEEYCKRCYVNGEFTLDCWKRYLEIGGKEKFEEFKRGLIDEFNALNIEGMPAVDHLNVIPGSEINFEYEMPNRNRVKLLDDRAAYLGDRLECEFGGGRYYGIAANMQFLLVFTYGKDGENPELVIYRGR